MVRRLLYFDYILSVRILEVIGESARCGFFFKLLFLKNVGLCFFTHHGGCTGLDSLTRRHGVKSWGRVVYECILAVGNVIGHVCVLAASKMNNAIVLFFLITW